MKILIIIICYPIFLFSQVIKFPERWFFKIGDSSIFKNENYDESNWQKIKVPSHWENEINSNYDGFGWYRMKFEVSKKFLNKELYLLIGKIDDADETYLNGILIGTSGKFPPNANSEWNSQRTYKIPKELLKEKNILAVKVFDMGGPGGIHNGVFGIYDKKNYLKEMNLFPGAKKSFYNLVTANGLIAAVYNDKENKIESIFPHIFQRYDESNTVKPFIKNLKLSSDEKILSISYFQNTHIIQVEYKSFKVFYFAPFSKDEKIFYAVISGDRDKIKQLSFTYEKSYCDILEDELEVDTLKYFLFSFNDTLHNNSHNLFKSKEELLNKKNILLDEITFMKNIFSKCMFSKKLSEDEKNLYQQSITILKMAQVSQKEIFEKSRGQILASLPPGIWNITWIRDAAYSIMALNKLGLFEESKNALQFFLNADAGYYKNFVFKDGIDYGIKCDYQISVCRYFGTGKEESDFNENGPNIEIDGFGLFLIAFCDYINSSNDYNYLNKNIELVETKIADVLLKLIDKNNLIRKDSGPWERHLTGKQYAYTSITAAKGLKDFADLSSKYFSHLSEKYFSAYKRLLHGINDNLVVNKKFIKNNSDAINNKDYEFYDASTFEFFNFDLSNDKKFFDSHYIEYEKKLRINNERGFIRINNGDWYDNQEWIFLNLRISLALIKFGYHKKAKKLIDWITKQSKLNYNLIAELYENKKSTYEGAVPMAGFGAANFILSISNYLK